MRIGFIGSCVLLLSLCSCASERKAEKTPAEARAPKTAKEAKGAAEEAGAKDKEPDKKMTGETKSATALFGGGCFWCTEAIFQEVDGVSSVVSGYAGGKVENPTYKQVCSGTTGHAEVVKIEYDPGKAKYEKLLEIFFATHNPTTLNRQGADVGTQYRSVVFYFDDDQKAAAEKKIKELDASGKFKDPIVTEVTAAPTFYPAEEHHQDYYRRNPDQPYSAGVIKGKLEKFKQMNKK